MLIAANSVGLALMRAEDVPIITRWNQDLDVKPQHLCIGCLAPTDAQAHGCNRNVRSMYASLNASPSALIEYSSGRSEMT